MDVLNFTFLVIGACIVSSWTQSIFRKSDLNVQTFKGKCDNSNWPDASLNKLNYFRYLVPSEKDHDILYIGAMNYVFKVYEESMNCSESHLEQPVPIVRDICRIHGKSADLDCQNHIRSIMERGDMLHVCGTGSYSPIVYKLDRNLVKNGSNSNGAGNCPFDPMDNFTAILVSPQFVGSFDDPLSVMFFLQEIATESNKKMYATVAKVCKYDLGEKPFTQASKIWLSFQKARLVCSLPGDYPYHFDHIYDIFERDDQYYALFIKLGANLNASAICIYDKQDINNVFNGAFQYEKPSGVWEVLPKSLEPSPRLDNCTALKSNPDAFKNRVSRYQLMHESVQPIFGRPVYYIHGVQLLQIAVSKPVYSGTGELKDISRNIYAASDSGEIYYIFMKNFSNESVPFITELNSIYRPFSKEPNASYAVWDMKFLEDDSLLGFGTDVEVANLNLIKLCSQSTKLNTCIPNTHCQWNKSNGSCIATIGNNLDEQDRIDYSDIGITGVMNSIENKIKTDTVSISFIEGGYAKLPLSTIIYCADVTWVSSKQNNAEKDCLVGENCLDLPNKFAVTSNGDLVIMNITSEDRGTYTACPVGFKHVGLIQYKLQIQPVKSL